MTDNTGDKKGHMLTTISVEKSADNIYCVINYIVMKNKKYTCYSWKRERSFPKVEMKPEDQKKLWKLTDDQLIKYL